MAAALEALSTTTLLANYVGLKGGVDWNLPFSSVCICICICCAIACGVDLCMP